MSTNDLQSALEDAIAFAEEGWAYASDYFKEKWRMKERTEELRQRAGVGALEPLPRDPPPTPEVIGFSAIRCTICGAARQAHEDGSAGACSALDCKDPLHDLRATSATGKPRCDAVYRSPTGYGSASCVFEAGHTDRHEGALPGGSIASWENTGLCASEAQAHLPNVGDVVQHPSTGTLGIVSAVKMHNYIVKVGLRGKTQCWPNTVLLVARKERSTDYAPGEREALLAVAKASRIYAGCEGSCVTCAQAGEPCGRRRLTTALRDLDALQKRGDRT